MEITKRELRALDDDELMGVMAAAWLEWRMSPIRSDAEGRAARVWYRALDELLLRSRRRRRREGRITEDDDLWVDEKLE